MSKAMAIEAADQFLAEIYEETFGKDGAERAAIVIKKTNKDLNSRYPRFIPVINRGTQMHDGIAPGELGVTARECWSEWFQEVEVEPPVKPTPKKKAPAKKVNKEESHELNESA